MVWAVGVAQISVNDGGGAAAAKVRDRRFFFALNLFLASFEYEMKIVSVIVSDFYVLELFMGKKT
jgi:hypothetical protein